jgi:hypothetical protein
MNCDNPRHASARALCALTVAVLLLAVALIVSNTAAARQAAATPQWEYKVESIPTEKKLNELGAQGWELVAVESSDRAGRNCYFKRAK